MMSFDPVGGFVEAESFAFLTGITGILHGLGVN